MIDALAQREIEAFETAKNAAANDRHNWQEIAKYVAPHKSDIMEAKSRQSDSYTHYLWDTEAVHANDVLAASLLEYVCSGKFFEWQSPRVGPSQVEVDWYQQCSDIGLRVLSETNFAATMHEAFYDYGGFGTTHVHCDEDPERTLYFKHFQIGSYYVTEDKYRLVSTVRAEIKMTAQQAAQEFGEEAVMRCEKMSKALTAQKADVQNQQWDIIVTCRRREDAERQPGKMDGKNKPWAAIYVAKDDKCVLREGGYDEQPFAVARFALWGDGCYGWSPSHQILDTIKQVQVIERDLDALGEKAAFPPVLIPKGSTPQVRVSAGQVTVWDPGVTNGATPQEWLTGGRYDIGLDRVERKRAMIRRAYFNDAFQLLTNLDELKREKTAFEVQQMMSEKLRRISPAFGRTSTELLTPLLQRVFSILMRQGKLPPAPPEVMELSDESPTGYAVPMPKINLVSRLALELKAIENQNFFSWVNLMQPVFAMYGPEQTAQFMRQHFNPERLLRVTADNQGVPVNVFNTDEERKDIIAEDQAAAQAQEGMMAAESASKVVGNMGKLPPQILERLSQSQEL